MLLYLVIKVVLITPEDKKPQKQAAMCSMVQQNILQPR